jgi:TetR/AcrR family transcriptional regulator, regulator of cefoperazone and chloramphenicol sensitivity
MVTNMNVSRSDHVLASVEDLTPAARIRNAALELFATRGVRATSVRAVAAAADVSPGLVQHYYPTKAALREAVDRYVLEVTASAYADLPSRGATVGDRVEEIGKRVTNLFRDRALGHRYVARGVVDGDERALAMFDALVTLVSGLVLDDMAEGRIPQEVDATWAALHTVVFHFGVVLLEHAINRQLPERLRSDEGLERWRRATGALYRHGLYRAEADQSG